MSQNQTESKPSDAEQESGKGLDETPCSPCPDCDGRGHLDVDSVPWGAGEECRRCEGHGTLPDDAPEWWAITVGGYGTFLTHGIKSETEEVRRHKARWEGATAKKRLATAGEIQANLLKDSTSAEYDASESKNLHTP
jgi:hypothetical protein